MKYVYIVFYWSDFRRIEQFQVYDSLKLAKKNCPGAVKLGPGNWINTNKKYGIL